MSWVGWCPGALGHEGTWLSRSQHRCVAEHGPTMAITHTRGPAQLLTCTAGTVPHVGQGGRWEPMGAQGGEECGTLPKKHVSFPSSAAASSLHASPRTQPPHAPALACPPSPGAGVHTAGVQCTRVGVQRVHWAEGLHAAPGEQQCRCSPTPAPHSSPTRRQGPSPQVPA